MRSTGAFEHVLDSAEAMACFGSQAIVQHMLDFEAALAASQAELGIIPQQAASSILACCTSEAIDGEALLQDSVQVGSLAIPLVRQLRARIAQSNPQAARYLHYGATSQDVIDTALVLAIKKVLALLEAELSGIVESLADLAREHRSTPVLARTLLQAAQVTSLGAKCANWLAPIARSRHVMQTLKDEALCVQFGGAIGTRSLLGTQGEALARMLAQRLGLSCSATAWHTQRDRLARLAAELGILAGSLGKIGRDWALMMQGEVGELRIAAQDGRAGSSAMPHKDNPIAAMRAIAASTRAPFQVAALLAAMPQEHERGLGNWQTESLAWSELCAMVLGSAQAIHQACRGLRFDQERMRQNIAAQRGIVFSEAASQCLADHLGKDHAEALVRTACDQALSHGTSLAEELRHALAGDAQGLELLERPEVFSVTKAAAAAAWVVDATLEELVQWKNRKRP